MEKLVTTKEIAKKYQINIQTARLWCQNGLVKAKKVGKRWYIDIKEREKNDY